MCLVCESSKNCTSNNTLDLFLSAFLFSWETAYQQQHSWIKYTIVELVLRPRHLLSSSLLVCLVSYNLTYYSSLICYVYIALLICLDNSSWNQSQSAFFINGFCKAFDMYTDMGTRENVEVALKAIGNWPRDMAGLDMFKSQLFEMILKHQICMLNSIFL